MESAEFSEHVSSDMCDFGFDPRVRDDISECTLCVFGCGILETKFCSGAHRLNASAVMNKIHNFQENGIKEVVLETGIFPMNLPREFPFRDFSGRHHGETAYVIGNGPSLAHTDMSLIKDKVTFGSNRCYLGFEQWGFHFKYWVSIDRLQIEENVLDYERNLPAEMVKFLPYDYVNFCRYENQVFFNQSYEVMENPLFSADPSIVYMGNSVTYTMMQLAVMMGCKRIVLLGIDHNYPMDNYSESKTKPQNTLIQKLQKTLPGEMIVAALRVARDRYRCKKSNPQVEAADKSNETWTAADTTSATHFDPRYTAGKRFVAPRLGLIENAYRAAKEWGDANGVEIVNATPGTNLEIFPKVKLEDVLS